MSAAAVSAAVRVLTALLPFVKKLLRWCGVPERDVPDVAQDVLIQVWPWWSSRRAIEPEAPPEVARAYVRVTAIRSGARHCREGARRRERLGFEPEWSDVEGDNDDEARATVHRSSEASWLEREAAADLAEGLDVAGLAAAADPASWRIFWAYVVEEIAVREIAESEQLSVPAIYARLRATRLALSAAIQRRRAAKRTK